MIRKSEVCMEGIEMNGFWKKKLPAFLLAMTLVISLVPAAGAVEDCA